MKKTKQSLDQPTPEEPLPPSERVKPSRSTGPEHDPEHIDEVRHTLNAMGIETAGLKNAIKKKVRQLRCTQDQCSFPLRDLKE